MTRDLDDARVLRGFEQRDDVACGATRHLGDEIHGRRGGAGRGEEHRLHVGVETIDPGLHQLGKGVRQRGLGNRRVGSHRPCQFDCVEGISARDLLYPQHGRPRERPVQSLGDARRADSQGSAVAPGSDAAHRAGVARSHDTEVTFAGPVRAAPRTPIRPDQSPRREFDSTRTLDGSSHWRSSIASSSGVSCEQRPMIDRNAAATVRWIGCRAV